MTDKILLALTVITVLCALLWIWTMVRIGSLVARRVIGGLLFENPDGMKAMDLVAASEGALRRGSVHVFLKEGVETGVLEFEADPGDPFERRVYRLTQQARAAFEERLRQAP